MLDQKADNSQLFRLQQALEASARAQIMERDAREQEGSNGPFLTGKCLACNRILPESETGATGLRSTMAPQHGAIQGVGSGGSWYSPKKPPVQGIIGKETRAVNLETPISNTKAPKQTQAVITPKKMGTEKRGSAEKKKASEKSPGVAVALREARDFMASNRDVEMKPVDGSDAVSKYPRLIPLGAPRVPPPNRAQKYNSGGVRRM